jgi:hypothetical protein
MVLVTQVVKVSRQSDDVIMLKMPITDVSFEEENGR